MKGSKFIPKSHPRFLSLYYREILAEGVKRGITSLTGLTAHGRGEAFDYLLGEKTPPFAKKSIETCAAILLLAKYPVMSVNGNTAVLVPKELISLSQTIGGQLEVNIFHPSKNREKKIRDYLIKMGAKNVLLPDKGRIKNLESNRRKVSSLGQEIADVIFVPLEDGDRTEFLKAMGKKIITVDLNPLSRTAQKSDITIVDNIVRALPLLIAACEKLKRFKKSELKKIVNSYDNKKNLNFAIRFISKRLLTLASEIKS